MIEKPLHRSFLSVAGVSVISLGSSHAALITQTANQPSGTPTWSNALVWGSPLAAATAGNTYTTATFLALGVDNGIGVASKGTLRDTNSAFAGDSVTIIAETELLLKNGNNTTTTGNIILNGGALRYGPNGTNPAFSTTVAGSLNVLAPSIVGLGGNNTVIISSSLTGSSILSLRAASGATAANTLAFSGDLSGFTGTLDLGWTATTGTAGNLTLDFNQDYVLLASLVMGNHASIDILNLDQAITLKSFQFGATILAPDNYTAAELNALVGNGAQFTGAGSLTVIPEPSAVLLGGLGSLLIIRRRRSI